AARGACGATEARLPPRRPPALRAPHRAPAPALLRLAAGDARHRGRRRARRTARARARPAGAVPLEGEPAEGRSRPGADAPAGARRPPRAHVRARPARATGVYELVAEATANGRTVFVSSHVLSEVQHIADRGALIREGRLQLLDCDELLTRGC